VKKIKKILLNVTDGEYNAIKRYSLKNGDSMTGILRESFQVYKKVLSGQDKIIDSKLYELLMFRYDKL